LFFCGFMRKFLKRKEQKGEVMSKQVLLRTGGLIFFILGAAFGNSLYGMDENARAEQDKAATLRRRLDEVLPKDFFRVQRLPPAVEVRDDSKLIFCGLRGFTSAFYLCCLDRDAQKRLLCAVIKIVKDKAESYTPERRVPPKSSQLPSENFCWWFGVTYGYFYGLIGQGIQWWLWGR